MTQMCTVLEALKAAQTAVQRATSDDGAQKARERFYDAVAAYDESHGDDPVTPTCRVCAETLIVGEHRPHDETCLTGGFCSCRDEVHASCAVVCVGCWLPLEGETHYPHEDDCEGVDNPLCRCDRPTCAGCCTEPGCRA